jgi:hypothetical protein
MWWGIARKTNCIAPLPAYSLRSRLKFSTATYSMVFTLHRGVAICLNLRGTVPKWTVQVITSYGTSVEYTLAPLDGTASLWNTILEKIEVLPGLRTYAEQNVLPKVQNATCIEGIPFVLHQLDDAVARETAIAAFRGAQL